jgi:hypothetical protein
MARCHGLVLLVLRFFLSQCGVPAEVEWSGVSFRMFLRLAKLPRLKFMGRRDDHSGRRYRGDEAGNFRSHLQDCFCNRSLIE